MIKSEKAKKLLRYLSVLNLSSDKLTADLFFKVMNPGDLTKEEVQEVLDIFIVERVLKE